MVATELKKYIPELKENAVIEKIDRGFSLEERFLVKQGNKKLLLRVSSIKDFSIKLNEYNMLTKLQEQGVKSSKPISIGLQSELGICYMILSYLEGKDGVQGLELYSKEDQFKIGVEAGKQLRKMHNLSAPKEIESWYDRRIEKHNKYIKCHKNCGINIKNEDKIIKFIEDNLKYMKSRPNTFQHEDFHPANIIVNNKSYMGVIDFNSWSWGDPYHDFCKMALLGREISVPFSKGQIQGYFDNNIPEDFWRIYALYAAMSIFSSIIWTIKEIPKELPSMLEKLYIMLEDHRYFESLKPKWYE